MLRRLRHHLQRRDGDVNRRGKLRLRALPERRLRRPDRKGRREKRLRRLRFIASLFAAVEAEDADNREARRMKWGEIFATDPRAFALLAGVFAGPEAVPQDAFDDGLFTAVRAA